MTDQPPMTPYGSARDLPSVMELEQQIQASRLLGFLLPRNQRKEIKRLHDEQRRITDTVDAFYALLGPRNWVFTGDLQLDDIQAAIATADPNEAEQRLVEYYQSDDRILFPLRQLNRFAEMRPRMPLLQKALIDYEAGRYYSTVLVLLSVMDGFVNELNTAHRKGLHARAPEDMVAWDSVVGHHLGLGHAHQSFIKSYFKTDTSETTELARNGIMHRTLVNYDNVIVATKAWNRLFAIADWADSRKIQAVPVERPSTFREVLSRCHEMRVNKIRLEQWKPHVHDKSSFAEDPSEVVTICTDFLERWRKCQWGPLGQHFIQFGSTQRPLGELAEEAKDLYRQFTLEEWDILRVRHVGAAVAHADVKVTVNSEPHQADLRWVRIDETGEVVMEWKPGRWSLSPYGPTIFLKPEP
ncbi:hypothetical protein M0E87_10585 [Corynebacterium sp. CCM 9185]|uniref:DUF2397 domain-containing protein n=1 Tax=Corynebacterium marambiense TaxID=2765364 RepID=A0ABS0VX64_9CORY|nr:hypothetical protein [Corynebacterium marambiense]MBI9001376.1 hypothetical protein [Corynebacterium marambiense]MCK7664098.1 hypothetical protein [Corynebacterium marambiense]